MHSSCGSNSSVEELLLKEEIAKFRKENIVKVETINLFHLQEKIYELVLENKDAYYSKGVENYLLEDYAVNQAMVGILEELPIGIEPPEVVEARSIPLYLKGKLTPCLINEVITTIEFLIHEELNTLLSKYHQTKVNKVFSYYLSPYIYVLLIGLPKENINAGNKS